VDVTIQLAIIMIGKQVANNAKQIIIPYVSSSRPTTRPYYRYY